MRAAAIAMTTLCVLPVSAQQARPLPDQETFVREVRKHL